MNKLFIYGTQVMFVCGIAVGSQKCNLEDALKLLNVVRYIIYLLTIKSIPHLCTLVHKFHTSGDVNVQKLLEEVWTYLLVYLTSVLSVVYFKGDLLREDFLYVGLAYLIVRYPKMASNSTSKPSINYGVGMACSFFEGYLMHIIPSDGARFVGFEENITILEDKQGVLFPVKKLFIIITKNLFCPPDLKAFNKSKDVPHMEAFNYLEDIQKSVAGVKDRIYRNTAYKIYRPHAPPVCLTAECATPLHTLYRVVHNRALYQEVADIEVPRVVEDFCTTLQSILDKSPECRGKCELVYYDNEDPKQNLADILLERIRALAPDFEERILARRDENVPEQ